MKFIFQRMLTDEAPKYLSIARGYDVDDPNHATVFEASLESNMERSLTSDRPFPIDLWKKYRPVAIQIRVV